jgi:hypothetical protein
MCAEALAQNPRLKARIALNSMHSRGCHSRTTASTSPPAVPPSSTASGRLQYCVNPGACPNPGAAAIIALSDRRFQTRAIALWTELHPFERMGLVLEYFRQAGNCAAQRISARTATAEG